MVMAELRLYKCKKCGWSIEAPKDGSDILMDGLLVCFVCNHCKHIFVKSYAFGTDDDGWEECPKCKCLSVEEWKPADGCPKCGGELEDKGLSCLMD